jgi:hypothetical protein
MKILIVEVVWISRILWPRDLNRVSVKPVKGPFYATAWACFLSVVLSLPLKAAQIDPALQETGVLYFYGNLPGEVFATFHTSTTIYLHRDFQTPLASIYNGQKAELIGMSPEGFLVKTMYRNNSVTGWLRPEDLPTGIDPALFVEAKKNQAHRDSVSVAIANKNVIQGMTPEEVKQAVGQPEQVASRVDPSGSSLTWTYTTYREDPQYEYTLDPYGRPFLQTYYVRVPIGQLIVSFVNGMVISVQQRKTDPNGPGIVTG